MSVPAERKKIASFISLAKSRNLILHRKIMWDLCEALHLIDYKRGAKLAGAGSWVYCGLGARLEWALLNFFIEEHLADGYELMLVPHMLGYECGYVAGQFPKFTDEVYWIENANSTERKFLLPTAETALVNLHRDEILTLEELPKKYIA